MNTDWCVEYGDDIDVIALTETLIIKNLDIIGAISKKQGYKCP